VSGWRLCVGGPWNVAEADSVDQSFVAGLNERRELGVEALARLGSVHKPEVDGGEPVEAERHEVLLEASA
jgi:hypothetical protein